MTCLNELERSQWWTQDRIIELQNERLQELMKHAYDNVSYYRRIFDERGLKPGDIRSSADLKKLPVLNKRIIRHNFELLKASDFWARSPIPASTSGSTGEPLVFYSTKDDQHNWGYARALRTRSWSGYRLGDKIAIFRSRLPNETLPEKVTKGTKRFFRRSALFEPQTMSEETMPLIARNLEAFRPKFIGGYPSAIYLLARYFQKQGTPKFELQAVMASAEQIYDYQRELFHKVFGCETYSYYSSWEVLDIAAECPQHTGYHIAAENLIVEVTDEVGNPLPVGMEGRILLTNLHNYAMPFIRYDIGDSGTISDVVCPCGRSGLPLLVNLSGRADAIIYTRSGKQIPGRSIPHRFLAQLGVEQFQIVQENYGEVVVRLVMDKEYPPKRKEQVVREIKAQFSPIFGAEIDVKVQFAQQITAAKSGKREVIISKLSSNPQ